MKKNKQQRLEAKAQGANAETATVEQPKKVKKVRTEELDEKNLENTKKKITKEKDLMYQYPDGVNDLDKRKTFRSNTRRKLASFMKSIAKAPKEEKSELIKAAKDWAAEIYTPAYMPNF